MPFRQMTAPVEAICDTCHCLEVGYIGELKEKGWRSWTPPNVNHAGANSEVICPACAQLVTDALSHRSPDNE